MRTRQRPSVLLERTTPAVVRPADDPAVLSARLWWVDAHDRIGHYSIEVAELVAAWALIRIEHGINLYQLNRTEAGEAAGRRLVMQVDAIVAGETHGWAERLRASGSRSTGTSPAVG